MSEFAGVGISYRPEFADFQQRLAEVVDCVEILFEGSFPVGKEGTEVLGWPHQKAAHAMTLSPARADFQIQPELRLLLAEARDNGIVLLSDHLSYSSVGEYSVPNFFSCTRTAAEADRIAGNIAALREAAQMNVAIENPVTFLSQPSDAMSETQFVNTVLNTADCGMVLDVNNLYIDAKNNSFDPYDYIRSLDGDRIAYLHVAGHAHYRGLLVDSHDSNVDAEVWQLLDFALGTTGAAAVILERDNRSATEEVIMSELDILRSIWNRHRKGTACAA